MIDSEHFDATYRDGFDGGFWLVRNKSSPGVTFRMEGKRTDVAIELIKRSGAVRKR